MIGLIFVLLIAFQIKHFIADYPLQTPYMLGKFKPFPDCIGPLSAHCGVHAGLTGIITLITLQSLPWAFGLALLDFVIHFTMDIIKANPSLLGRFKPMYGVEYIDAVKENNTRKLRSNTLFWWALGLDQMVHHLTHYILIYLIIQHL